MYLKEKNLENNSMVNGNVILRVHFRFNVPINMKFHLVIAKKFWLNGTKTFIKT